MNSNTSTIHSQCFASDGFFVTPPILDDEECLTLEAALAQIGDKGVGLRHLLDYPWCRQLAQRLRDESIIAALLPPTAVAIQCTYFEKSREQNWLVSLHQDLSIPVAEKIDHAELSGWSEKEGITFVQPPSRMLEQLVAVRLHLDTCGPEDGPLKVVPGSHRAGRLNDEEARRVREQCGEQVCTVAVGAALVMKPLLLHASSKATGDSKRRVLHFVFGPKNLPYGLRWQIAV